MGYRYYQKHGIPVRYPFGHGLSYTTFSHSEWQRDGDTYTQTITNTGSRFGGEVAQLYLNGELKGFAKGYLNPGESKKATLTIGEEPNAVYSDSYTVPALPKPYPITLESRFTDLIRWKCKEKAAGWIPTRCIKRCMGKWGLLPFESIQQSRCHGSTYRLGAAGSTVHSAPSGKSS